MENYDFDAILQQIVNDLKFDRSLIKRRIEALDDKDYKDNLAVIDVLASSRYGIYMVPALFRQKYIDIDLDIVNQEGFWDFVNDQLLPKLAVMIDIKDTFIDFVDEGLAIVHIKRDL